MNIEYDVTIEKTRTDNRSATEDKFHESVMAPFPMDAYKAAYRDWTGELPAEERLPDLEQAPRFSYRIYVALDQDLKPTNVVVA